MQVHSRVDGTGTTVRGQEIKTLVTEAGFIGSHVVDNLSEGHLENIAHLKDDRRFRFAKPARRTYIDICIQIRI